MAAVRCSWTQDFPTNLANAAGWWGFAQMEWAPTGESKTAGWGALWGPGGQAGCGAGPGWAWGEGPAWAAGGLGLAGLAPERTCRNERMGIILYYWSSAYGWQLMNDLKSDLSLKKSLKDWERSVSLISADEVNLKKQYCVPHSYTWLMRGMFSS